MKSTVVSNIVIKGLNFEYTITYKNIKNIYFNVQEDGKINVRSNKLASKKYIEDILKNNEDFIYNSYQKLKEKQQQSEDIYYLGNKLNLVICDKNPYINADYIYAKNKEEAMQYIYSLAFDIFNERLMAIKPQFNNLPEFRLRVRKMKTRWGVCNKKSMTITLNLDLILKDVHLIDYVIVHELCHFKYMDHSPAFWRYVGTFYPYYKQARRELNR